MPARCTIRRSSPQQVRRLVADPRAHALFDGFGAPGWASTSSRTQPFDEKKFPQMTKDLRKAMFATKRPALRRHHAR
jgi:hypothetical protein